MDAEVDVTDKIVELLASWQTELDDAVTAAQDAYDVAFGLWEDAVADGPGLIQDA